MAFDVDKLVESGPACEESNRRFAMYLKHVDLTARMERQG